MSQKAKEDGPEKDKPPKRTRKKRAQDTIPGQQAPASPAAEPIMKDAQPAATGAAQAPSVPAEEKHAETVTAVGDTARPNETPLPATPATEDTAAAANSPGKAVTVASHDSSETVRVGPVPTEAPAAQAIEPLAPAPTNGPEQSPPKTEDIEAAIARIESRLGPIAPLGVRVEDFPSVAETLGSVDRIATASSGLSSFGVGPSARDMPAVDPNSLEPGLRNAVIKLKNPKADVRLDGISRIANMMAGTADAAVPSLIRLLEDKEDGVRYNAAWALGKIGKGAKAAVPFLVDLLHDRCADMRHFAAASLGEIGDRSAIEPLERVLILERDWTVKDAAKKAIGKLKERPA